MSRFTVTTCLTLVALGVSVLLTDGATRWWVCGLLILAYAIVFALGVIFINLQFFCRVFCHGQRTGGERQTIALTFDDGPDAQTNALLLDLLERLNVRATFFCVGSKVVAQPEITRRIVDAGHTIGNHTFNHSYWTNFMLSAGLQRQIGRTQEAIEQAAGVKARFFRPPVGLTNPHFSGVLSRMGLVMVGWDIRPLDRFRSPQAVVKMVTRKARPGSVVLMHDGDADCESLLIMVEGAVTMLQERGFEFVTIEQLISEYEN